MPDQVEAYDVAKTNADDSGIRAEGAAAYRAGRPGQSCPYAYGTAKCDVWWGGYIAARDGRVVG